MSRARDLASDAALAAATGRTEPVRATMRAAIATAIPHVTDAQKAAARAVLYDLAAAGVQGVTAQDVADTVTWLSDVGLASLDAAHPTFGSFGWADLKAAGLPTKGITALLALAKKAAAAGSAAAAAAGSPAAAEPAAPDLQDLLQSTQLAGLPENYRPDAACLRAMRAAVKRDGGPLPYVDVARAPWTPPAATGRWTHAAADADPSSYETQEERIAAAFRGPVGGAKAADRPLTTHVAATTRALAAAALLGCLGDTPLTTVLGYGALLHSCSVGTGGTKNQVVAYDQRLRREIAQHGRIDADALAQKLLNIDASIMTQIAVAQAASRAPTAPAAPSPVAGVKRPRDETFDVAVQEPEWREPKGKKGKKGDKGGKKGKGAKGQKGLKPDPTEI
eukprot:TRINITY_DN3571_c0_g1_i1.p3 TRINITY_DN3571_c0_g1~~TRINITY_DN3571_c0_g1_i1.p3  ORF type:complete len:393 (+),score=97.63 TRINITY_DN3571_c0_g1_i1:24-1202(+)